jgi:SAM-dependent methyltransferase
MKLRHSLARLFLRTVGRTSSGVRLCLDTGLTSGKTVDYVYRNQPAGCCGIGRWIDRRFLADPGWEAVRLRRKNLENLLLRAVACLRQRGAKVHILDIASGPGAYVIAVAQAAGGDDLSARCCDLDERWLREGQAEAGAKGLRQVCFQTGDAFDREAILGYSPRPNIAIASGFYDWITGDDDVKRSLAILFEALEPGGFLVLTNQVSHPDLAFVSAVFTDFHQQPLRMRMRPAAQIREWLEHCGFVHEESLMDPRGHYSVTLARKP